MIVRKRAVALVIALFMMITFIPLSAPGAYADSDMRRITLIAYDVTTGETFTDGISWVMIQDGYAVNKNSYTFPIGIYIKIKAYLNNDSPYVATEWRKHDPVNGETVSDNSEFRDIRVELTDETYYLLVEPKCPKDGGRHEWSQVIRKATLSEDGEIHSKCGKCGTEELVSTIAAVGGMELKTAFYTYDGGAKEPVVKVYDTNGDTIDPAYYTVTYEDNVAPGAARAIVTFNTYYEGEEELIFRIIPLEAELPEVQDFTYDGETKTGVMPGTGYTLSGTVSAADAGSYQAEAALMTGYEWTDGTDEPKTIVWKINKADNTLAVKAKTATVKFKQLKKKDQALAVSKVLQTVDKGQGKVTYAKSKGSNKITINKKSGKVTVKKGLKKGTYTIKVKIKAAGDKNYDAVTKTVSLKVRVK